MEAEPPKQVQTAKEWAPFIAGIPASAKGASEALDEISRRVREDKNGSEARAAADAGAIKAALRLMRAHTDDVSVQSAACAALHALSSGEDDLEQSRAHRATDAAAAGALELMVGAMRKHEADASVQERACSALRSICWGDDVITLARKRHAAEAGAIDAAVRALSLHTWNAAVQEQASAVLRTICWGVDVDAVLKRRQMAVAAGALPALVGAMDAHASNADVQVQAIGAFDNLCTSTDEGASTAAQAAVDAGGIKAVVRAMREHQNRPDVIAQACWALLHMCHGTNADGRARKERAAEEGAIEETVRSMCAHPLDAKVQAQGCWALAIICEGSAANAPTVKLRERAAAAGVRATVKNSRLAHPKSGLIKQHSAALLKTLPKNPEADSKISEVALDTPRLSGPTSQSRACVIL